MIFVWTFQDVLGLAIFAFVVAGILILWIPSAIQRLRCKHDGDVGETNACDAICIKCGANLGFIGAWRERHPKQ